MIVRNKICKGFFLFCVNLLAVIILFVVAENLVRITLPQIHPLGTDRNILADSLYYGSPGLHPNSRGISNGAPVFVDANGCRKTFIPFHPHQKSWLLVGDSVTFGIGVGGDSTFAGIIQSRLDSLNVLNPSVIGYAVKDYENVIRHFLEERPDLNVFHVTVCWCLNDLYEDIPDVEEPGGKLRSAFSDILLWLRSNSRLFLFLKNTFWDRPRSYYLFDAQFYELEHSWLLLAVERLSAIHELCESRHLRFDVMLLPYAYQMREPGHAQPQETMGKLLDERGIRCFDLLDEIKPSKDNVSLFLYGDGIHFSKNGHALIAAYFISKMDK